MPNCWAFIANAICRIWWNLLPTGKVIVKTLHCISLWLYRYSVHGRCDSFHGVSLVSRLRCPRKAYKFGWVIFMLRLSAECKLSRTSLVQSINCLGRTERLSNHCHLMYAASCWSWAAKSVSASNLTVYSVRPPGTCYFMSMNERQVWYGILEFN